MYGELSRLLIQMRETLKVHGLSGKFVLSVPDEDLEKIYNNFRVRNREAMPRGKHKDWRCILESVPITGFDKRDEYVS